MTLGAMGVGGGLVGSGEGGSSTGEMCWLRRIEVEAKEMERSGETKKLRHKKKMGSGKAR
jgi:hypothetical protein